MCMIAYRPHGAGHLPNTVIDTALNRHPDGYGLMWRDAEGLHTACYAPKQRKQFRKALKVLDKSGAEFASHFRWATSGPTNTDMAHPYTYEDPDPAVGTVAIMHNGVIGIKHDPKVESDTNAFVRLVLAALPSRWWTSPALVYLVDEAIGYSKFVLMTATETVNLHDRRGEWDEGLWYSSEHRSSKHQWTSKPTSGKGPVTYNATAAAGVPYISAHGVYVNNKWTPASSPEFAEQRALAVKVGARDTGSTAAKATTEAPALSVVKSAASSAASMGLLEAGTAVIRTTDMPIGFRHAGHNLTAIKTIDMEAGDVDYEDSVLCDTCGTVGTVYVIDGTYYIDMAHKSGADDDDEDALLPYESSFSQARVTGSVTH